MTNPSSPQYEDDIDLLRYGRFLASYWVLLLVFTLGGMTAALAIRSGASVKYQAVATMSVNANGTTAMAVTAATSRALLANLSLVAETINELQLNRDGLTPQSFISDVLQVQAVPATNLLRVSVTLSDPTKARLAANTLALKAVALSLRLDQEGAVKGRDALKKQMDEAGLRLEAAQARLLKYQTATHLDLLEEDTKSKLKLRSEIDTLRIEIQAETARQSRLEEELARQPRLLEAPRLGTVDPAPRTGAGEAGNADGSANPFANPVYSMLQYEVAQSRAKVSGLEQQLRGTRGGAEPSDTKMLNALYQRRMELDRLQTDSDVSKRVYRDLARRYEEARGQVAGSIVPQLQIVDAPVQPDRPLSRGVPQFAILGGLAGLLAGAVTAVLLNRRRALQGIS